jgi:hypothetical protein
MSSNGAISARAAASRANGARAAASRANGSKSKGPRTAEGKARSSRNALKHGLCAHKHLLLHDEHRAEFAALETALVEDLSPQGALQAVLAARIASAAWRMARADRMEAEILDERGSRSYGTPVCPGLALIRDGNGPRAFVTLLRYRGALVAELLRSLRALKDLQAEAAKAPARDAKPTPQAEAEPAPVLIFQSRRTRERAAAAAPASRAEQPAPRQENPNQPESRGKPAASERSPAAGPEPARCAIEPDGRGYPAMSAPAGPPHPAPRAQVDGPAWRGSDEPNER